jgi:hypothetical protein
MWASKLTLPAFNFSRSNAVNAKELLAIFLKIIKNVP